jgi:tRNA 2-selenouridine synthase
MKFLDKNEESMESVFNFAIDHTVNDCLFGQIESESQIQFIDLRSPIEFYESCIPGAVNVPIFSNEERVEVGTLYKQKGEKAARWRAMELVSPKIPAILESIKQFSDSGMKPVIYCWRGGMRSKSIAFFANLAGLNLYRLRDGYRGYRKYILEKSSTSFPKDSIILHGKTGVGKTEILQILKELDYPTLDLEKAANHKGSIFGSFGMGEANTQKMFDSYLYNQISTICGCDFSILEAESPRIGRISTPDFVQESIKNGVHILIKRSIKNRVERIYQEYVRNLHSHDDFHEKVEGILNQLYRRISNQQAVESLMYALESKDYKTIIQILMEQYYDPRYSYKENAYNGNYYTIESDDNNEIVAEIIKIIHIHQNNLAVI